MTYVQYILYICKKDDIRIVFQQEEVFPHILQEKLRYSQCPDE